VLKKHVVFVLCLFSALTLSAGVLPPVCVNSSGVYLSGTCANSGGVTSFSVDYNGFNVTNGITYIIPGLSATASFSNFVFDTGAKTIAFDVSATNTSTISGGSRLNAFGFDTVPVPTSGVISNSSAGNPYTSIDLNNNPPGNFPNGLSGIDFCIDSGANCQAGSGGLGNGQSSSFTATLTFASLSSSSTLLFQQFVDRYSAFSYTVPGGGPTIGSASGVAVVPEPTTYAFLLSLLTSGCVLYRKRRPAQE